MNKSFDRYANMKPTTKEVTMNVTKPAQPSYLLLNPLSPDLFGYENGEVTRMVNELKLVGINVLMVNTEREILLYAHSSKTTLESLCTCYDLGGMLVEYTALFDQATILEVA